MVFKKGDKPWNTGTKGIIKPWNKGLKGIKTSNKGQIAWNKRKKLHYDIWNKGKKGLQVAWNKGKHFVHSGSFKNGHDVPKEIRDKIKQKALGNKRWLGKHHKKESIEKIKNSDYHKNLGAENHPNWQGGIARLPYPYEFTKIKKYILKRDNYTCQEEKKFIT